MFTLGHIYYIYCSYIPDPHEKISLCICTQTPLFFWINSTPSFHGVGQELVPQAFAPKVLKKDSYLDLSGPRTYQERDWKRARDFGMISPDLRNLALTALRAGNKMLAEHYRLMGQQALT